MHKIILTDTEKYELELRHKAARDSRECDRIKAVLLRSEGWSTAMISQALRIHSSTVTNHLNDYISELKLKPENGGSSSLLTAEQVEEIIQHISDNVYTKSIDIVAYIQKNYGVTYTVSGINKWLHRVGFSYKRPKGVPHKVDLEKQAQFIEQYEELKKNLKEGEKIVFLDGTHPTQATKISYGWIKKGMDKTIQTTGSRTRLNILGALDLNDIAGTISTQFDTINQESVITFLKLIRDKNPENHRIYIVLDGAGYHRALLVREEAKRLNIELVFLPPYSPNLNPIERLWKVMNEEARNNRYFPDATSFRKSIGNFFEVVLPKIGESLTSRINDTFQRLNLAS